MHVGEMILADTQETKKTNNNLDIFYWEFEEIEKRLKKIGPK